MNTKRHYLSAVAALITCGTIITVDAQGRAGGFGSFDLNNDGNVTQEELSTASVALVQDLQNRFLTNYDSVATGQASGDGIIAVQESEAVHQAQAEEWLERLLAKYDTNNDGVISGADSVRSRGPGGLHHLGRLDSNNDGVVSATELVVAAETVADEHQEHFLKRFDSVPDGATAGDGIITAAESLAVHQEMVDEKVDGFLERFDLNDDGTVSAAEIAQVQSTPKRVGRGPRR